MVGNDEVANPVEATPPETPAPAPDSAPEPAPAAAPAPAPAKTLLEEDDAPTPDSAPEPAPADAPDEKTEAFLKAIPALDLGDGVQWDDATLRAVAPELMELTGSDAAKAQKLVAAYAKHVQAQRNAAAEEKENYNKALVEECKKRYGDDLKRVARDARNGGREFFGDEIWNTLKTVPEFANNPDVLERLAAYGRRMGEDDGIVQPHNDTTPVAEDDLGKRMYGNVKIG